MVALLLWTTACHDLLDPLPRTARRLTPPSVYARWWSMTEACSGDQGSLDRIAWYIVPGATTVEVHGQSFNGYYDPTYGGGRIVLAGESVLDGQLVRHEMLHALSRAGGHPRALFLGRCGGVVACEGQCIREGGPPPVPGSALRRVPAESLEVAVHVDPAQPSESADEGWFETIVTARNASADSVVVVLPPSGDNGPPAAFRFSFAGSGYNISYDDRAWVPETTIFGPGEVKQEVFDCLAGGSWPSFGVPLGADIARGAYGEHWAAPLPVTVGQ